MLFYLFSVTPTPLHSSTIIFPLSNVILLNKPQYIFISQGTSIQHDNRHLYKDGSSWGQKIKCHIISIPLPLSKCDQSSYIGLPPSELEIILSFLGSYPKAGKCFMKCDANMRIPQKILRASQLLLAFYFPFLVGRPDSTTDPVCVCVCVS